MRIEIPARRGKAVRLRRGQTVRRADQRFGITADRGISKCATERPTPTLPRLRGRELWSAQATRPGLPLS